MYYDDTDKDVITLTINGEHESLPYEEGEPLMQTLRRAGYTEIKNGCSEGVCGSCNVLYGDNQIARSCLVPIEQYEGEEIITAKGVVEEDGMLHPVQEEFLNGGAAQCGFCIPGIIVSAVQLLKRTPDPSEEEIRSALRGNICRCTGYVQQFEAIERAAERIDSDGDVTSAEAE